MDLLDYLPKETIETARIVAATSPIRIFAPEDTADLTRHADASFRFRMSFLAANGGWPDVSDLSELKANAEFIRGGPKVIGPSPQACRVMEHVELNLALADYAQPYESTGVVIPRAVSGLPKDVLAISHWSPGLGIFVGTRIGHLLLYIGSPNAGRTSPWTAKSGTATAVGSAESVEAITTRGCRSATSVRITEVIATSARTRIPNCPT